MIKYASDPTGNAFNNFLKNYGVFLAIGVAAILAIAVIVVLLIHFKANKNKDIAPVQEALPKDNTSLYEALGGKENVLHHERNGSRIAVELQDDKKLDADKLRGIGVDSIIKMSNKTILVVRNNPEQFYKLFN